MKYIIIGLFCSLFISQAWSQTPQKMSYQAVIRDSNGDLVINQIIGVKISILMGSIDGGAVYEETQNPETNSNGLMSLEIGGDHSNVISGNISEINWSNDDYFIKTETDLNGGTDYTIIGTSQLLSVPYALHANTADNLTGEITYNESDPVFNSSIASSIQEQDTANWNNKLDSFTETDPLFNSSVAGGLTESDTSSWNNKLDSFTEEDPIYNSSIAAGIQEQDTANWNNKLDSFTETDPLFNSSVAGGLTESDTSSWNNKLDKEVDGSITNEIQSFSVSETGDTLYISKGNWVIVPNISSANSDEETSISPNILGNTLTSESTPDGTNVTITTTIDNPDIVNITRIGLSILGPSQDVFYSNSEDNPTISEDTGNPGWYIYTHTFFIPNTAPTGDYTLIDIMIEHETGEPVFGGTPEFIFIDNG